MNQSGNMVPKETDAILKKIGRIAESEFLPIVGPRKGRVLVELIREVKPKCVLEIGTLIGYSAILMGRELGGEDHLITIEIDVDKARIAEKNLSSAGIKPKVEVIVGDAREIIPKLSDSFDFVFIDADKGEYLDYLRLVEDKLHKGSVVVADNAGFSAHQMRDYLDYVRSSGKFASRYTPVGGDGLEISVKL